MELPASIGWSLHHSRAVSFAAAARASGRRKTLGSQARRRRKKNQRQRRSSPLLVEDAEGNVLVGRTRREAQDAGGACRGGGAGHKRG